MLTCGSVGFLKERFSSGLELSVEREIKFLGALREVKTVHLDAIIAEYIPNAEKIQERKGELNKPKSKIL